jgi:hypothetical protein
MMRFVLGVIIIVFSIAIGAYRYVSLNDQMHTFAGRLDDAENKRDEGKALQKRIVNIRRLAMENREAQQKANMERILNIPSPRMEWKFIGPATVRDANRALYRYTFRIAGTGSYAEVQSLLDEMVKQPGFVPYRMCFACSQPPRGTPDDQKTVLIEGYLYAYDPDTL